MNVQARETREISFSENQGQLDLGLSPDGYRPVYAGMDAAVGPDLMPRWQDRPRPWDYDDAGEYRKDLDKFMREVMW